MSDFNFNFTKLIYDTKDHVSRLATLHSLAKLDNVDEIELLRMYGYITKRWRDRLIELSNNNWRKITDGLKLQYLRNCWPSGAMVTADADKTPKRCQTRVCPWCYMRKVATVYQDISDLLQPDSNLFGGTLTYYYTFTSTDDLVKLIRGRRNDISKYFKSSKKLLKFMFGGITVEPTKQLNQFKLVFRVLGSTTDDTLPNWLDRQWHFKMLTNPVGYQLRKLVSSTLKYPSGLMNYDPELTVKLLHAQEGIRTSAYFGKLREYNKRVLVS